jgi:hypothetical protein
MIENKKYYTLDEEEKMLVKNFSVLKDGKQIARGSVGISDNELLTLYETEPELALKDYRMTGLLTPSEPEAPEPSQLDRIEEAVNAIANSENSEAINALLGG